MGTAVVSGRIDQATKERADRIIRASGLTTGDVIKALWTQISQTGKVPECLTEPADAPEPDARMDRFLRFIGSIPPASQEFADMTDAQMRELMGSRDV